MSLKKLLEEKHITQAELGRRTGTSRQHIHNIVNGHYKARLDLIYNMANILDVDVEELIKEMLEEK